MNSKVKLFFIFLAVLAVVSVFSFVDIFSGVRSAKLTDATKPLLPVEEDMDQDGLSNTDESYWNTDFKNPDSDGDGFLDGEEVASGFDPREASSNELGDRLEDTVYGSVKVVEVGDFENTNLTNNVSGLLAGGIAAGDLTRSADQQTRNNSLSVLVDSTVDDFHKSLPVLDPTLNVVSDSKDNQIKYLESLAGIIKRDLIDLADKPNLNQDPFTQPQFFQTKAEHLKLSMDGAASLNVPQGWTETHKHILNLLNRSYLTYQAVADYDKDTIKAIIAFSDITGGLNTTIQDVLAEVQGKIKANGLQPDATVFQVMSAVY